MGYRQSENKKQILLIMLTVSSICFSNETLTNNLATVIRQPCQYVGIFAILIFMYKLVVLKERIKRNILLAIIFFLVPLLFVSFIDIGITNGYYLVVLNISIAYTIASYLKFYEYKKVFVNTIVILSAISLLLTYVLKSTLQHFPGIFPVVTNSLGIKFINARICFIYADNSYFRNTSIFREPGVYATFLIIALVYLLGERNKRHVLIHKNVKLFIIILAIISTFSSTGYIAMILVILCSLKINTRNFSIIKIIPIALILTILVLSTPLDDNIVMGVFSKWNSSSSSFQYRVESIINGLKSLSNNILIGNGILAGTNKMTNLNTLYYYNNTTTIITMIVYFGVVFFLDFAIGLLWFCRRKLGTMLYLLPMLLLLNSQQFIYNSVFYCLILYGYRKDDDVNFNLRPYQAEGVHINISN